MLRPILALVVAAHLPAQVHPGGPPMEARSAAEALKTYLAIEHLRAVPCLHRSVVNCLGGLEVVQTFQIGAAVQRGDTVWLPVRFQVLGVIASSEASLMFLPDRTESHFDSATITMRRAGARWALDSLHARSKRSVTSAAAARAFFRLDADDRRLLDSTVHARQRPTKRPPTAGPRPPLEDQ